MNEDNDKENKPNELNTIEHNHSNYNKDFINDSITFSDIECDIIENPLNNSELYTNETLTKIENTPAFINKKPISSIKKTYNKKTNFLSPTVSSIQKSIQKKIKTKLIYTPTNNNIRNDQIVKKLSSHFEDLAMKDSNKKVMNKNEKKIKYKHTIPTHWNIDHLQQQIDKALSLGRINYNGAKEMFCRMGKIPIAKKNICFWAARARHEQNWGKYEEAKNILKCGEAIVSFSDKKILKDCKKDIVNKENMISIEKGETENYQLSRILSPEKMNNFSNLYTYINDEKIEDIIENKVKTNESVNVKKEKTIQCTKKTVSNVRIEINKTNDSNGSSLVTLAEVKTPSKIKNIIKTPTFATPVRRSSRNFTNIIISCNKQENQNQNDLNNIIEVDTEETKEILKRTSFSYIENEALEGTEFINTITRIEMNDKNTNNKRPTYDLENIPYRRAKTQEITPVAIRLEKEKIKNHIIE